MPLDEADPGNPSAGRFDLGAPDDLIGSPIPTLDQDIGQERGDDSPGRRFRKRNQIVDVPDGAQDLKPLPQREDRPGRSLEPPDGRVAIEGDDETIAHFRGLVKEPDMSGVEEVEASVGEDDLFPLMFQPAADPDKIFEAVDFAAFFAQGIYP